MFTTTVHKVTALSVKILNGLLIVTYKWLTKWHQVWITPSKAYFQYILVSKKMSLTWGWNFHSMGDVLFASLRVSGLQFLGNKCRPLILRVYTMVVRLMMPTVALNSKLAHNHGQPCFSDVRIGNVFYSWPEMAKCIFYRICYPHLAKSYIYDSMWITYYSIHFKCFLMVVR